MRRDRIGHAGERLGDAPGLASTRLCHLRAAATTAADDGSERADQLPGVNALCSEVTGHHRQQLRPLIMNRCQHDHATAQPVAQAITELIATERKTYMPILKEAGLIK